MDLGSIGEHLLRLALLLVGLLAPGFAWLRLLRLPASLAAAFLASAATIYALLLLFACLQVPITFWTLGAALAVLLGLAQLSPARGPTSWDASLGHLHKWDGWTVLYAVFWAIVGYRLINQPLTGPDVAFRWSWLAEQIVRTGGLDFYPPRSGLDFTHYYWAESIPPGVASLYTWAYACGDSAHPLWTSPVVALQLLSLHELLWRLGHRWGGERVARRAVMLAAACPLLTWSILIGQETGLLAVAVLGLVWAIHQLAEAGEPRWAVLVGLFGVVAASTREYGLAFSLLAFAVAWIVCPRRRPVWWAVAALPVILAWPVRSWIVTGNPFYSLDVAGLFPTNDIFVAWTSAFHREHHFSLSPESWRYLGRYALFWSAPALMGLVAAIGLCWRLREARILITFAGLSGVLWFLSVNHTAGGLFYSTRVLAPAFALLVLPAAYATVALVHSRLAQTLVTTALTLVMVESLPRTLVLPENPYSPATRWASAGREFVDSVREDEAQLVERLLAMKPRRILADDASLQRPFTLRGIEVVPLWSPEVAWLFDPQLDPRIVARRWGASGLRYVVVGKSGASREFLDRRAGWRAPYFQIKVVSEIGERLVLDVQVPPSSQ